LDIYLEPVAVVNAAITIVEATTAIAVGLGLDWSAEQVGLVMAIRVATWSRPYGCRSANR